MTPDELLLIDPEPCDTCLLGISKFECYDGYRRCQRCVTHLADQNGWNQFIIAVPESAASLPAAFQPRRRRPPQEERLFD